MSSSGTKSSFKFRNAMGGSMSAAGSGRTPDNGGNENSMTQMAMMEDDNMSAAITHGGGGLTLHSRWKSQFDDSEGSENETEMKGEQLQSPEHRGEHHDEGDGGKPKRPSTGQRPPPPGHKPPAPSTMPPSSSALKSFSSSPNNNKDAKGGSSPSNHAG